MKAALLIGCLLAAATALAQETVDDAFDRLDNALTTSAWHDQVRMRVSGSLDLEGYSFQQPAPGLIYTDRNELFNPRLTLYLDAQLGGQLYFFAQSRIDQGFDPSDSRLQMRLDEYALRYTPWGNGVLNLQIGKFATVAGSWVLRHHSWENPFITAPLPYESLTGIFDIYAAGSVGTLLDWSGVKPAAAGDGGYFSQYRVPIIWGPSYATGASLSGTLGKFDYAVEMKNAAPASRPDSWNADQAQWAHPTFSGHLAYLPDEMWQLGLSASSGTYLQPSARPSLASGYGLGSYRETLLGQDVSFAWHHVQFWAEAFEASFAIPRVGQAGVVGYYLETKYKFTPQFSGAVRWNQQLYGTIPDGADGAVRWGRDVSRIDIAPCYRFTAHIEGKLQYSLQNGGIGESGLSTLLAAQIVVRF